MKIAFIGLGNMGGGMAANLAKAGHEVRAFDPSEEALTRAVDAGCTRAASAAGAVTGAVVVVTMLPAGKHVAGVYGTDVYPHAAPGDRQNDVQGKRGSVRVEHSSRGIL